MTTRPTPLMFADISGSTRLFERLGETEAGHAIERCLKRMTRSVEAYKGKTVQVIGDELLATFPSSEEACMAAIDMQERVADLPPASGFKLSIRIGLHLGEVNDYGNTLTGDAVTSAARIAGMAQKNQILASSVLIDGLNAASRLAAKPVPELGRIREGESLFAIHNIDWENRESAAADDRHGVHVVHGPSVVADRLCVRYRGQAFLLDDKTPVLTLGRDPKCKLSIVDRKASRNHGKIERRENGYFYTDSSTNGSFVQFAGQHEVMVRHDEILLHGIGRICFGASGNDPKSDFAEFEPI
jgi:class 3 adenylate cyclase